MGDSEVFAKTSKTNQVTLEMREGQAFDLVFVGQHEVRTAFSEGESILMDQNPESKQS